MASPLSIEVTLDRSRFSGELKLLKQEVSSVQGDINRIVASMKSAAGAGGGGAGRRDGGSSEGGGGKRNDKSIKDSIVVMEAAKKTTLEYAAANATLTKTQQEVAAATKAARVAVKGGTQEQQDYVAAISRAISTTTNFQKETERTQKQLIAAEKAGAKERIAASKAVIAQKEQLDHEYEQAQIAASSRQVKIAEEASRQALVKANQVNNDLLQQQIAAAKERAQAYYGKGSEIKKAQSDAIADQTRAAQRSAEIEKEKQQNFIQNAKAGADQYRQYIKDLSLADQRRISESKKIVTQREQLDREYEQSQIAASGRQAKIVENASRQALEKSNQADQLLRKSQIANAEEGRRLFAQVNQSKIDSDKEYYAERKKLADKFRNDQANQQKNLGKELQGVTELYRQQARPVRATPQQQATIKAESNVANLQLENRLLIEAKKAGLGYAEAMRRVRNEIEAINIEKTIGKPAADSLRTANAELDKTRKLYGESNNAARSFLGTIGHFILRFSAFTIAAGILIRVVFGIQQAITGIVERAINFQRTMENASFALAAILTNSRQLQTSTGAVADISASYPVFLQKAKQFQQELLLLNIKTLGTGEELQEVFQRVLAFSQTQKANDEERLRLTQNITNAAKLLGLTGEQINTETRQLLTLEAERGQTVLQSLGVTAKQLRVYRDQGTLVQKLNELLHVYSIVADDVALTFDGLLSTVSTFVDLIAGAAFEQTFGGLKNILKGMGDELLRLTKSGNLFVGLDSTTDDLKAFGAVAANTLANFIRLIAEATNAIIDFGVRNRDEIKGAIDIFAGFANALTAPIRAIVTLGGFIVGLVGKINDLIAAAARVPGLRFLQDQSSELANVAEAKINSGLNSGKLLGAGVAGAGIGAFLYSLAAKYAAVASAAALANAGIFATGTAATVATGGTILIAAGIGAAALALVELDRQNKAAIESSKRFGELKNIFLGLATSVDVFSATVPKTVDELNDFLKQSVEITKQLELLKGKFNTSGQEGADVFVGLLQQMIEKLAATTTNLEAMKASLTALIPEETMRGLRDLVEELNKAELARKTAEGKANITVKGIAAGKSEGQIEVDLARYERVSKFTPEEEKAITEKLKERDEALKRRIELQEQYNKALAAQGNLVQVPQVAKDFDKVNEQLEELKALDPYKTVEDLKNALGDKAAATEESNQVTERAIQGERDHKQAIEDTKTAIADLIEQQAQANRQFEKEIANFSQHPGGALGARLEEIGKEAEDEIAKLTERFKGNIPLDVSAKVDQVSIAKVRLAIVQSIREEEKLSQERIDIASNTQNKLAEIREMELDIEKMASEIRRENLQEELDLAEKNAGISGKPNSALEDRARLMRRIGDEEVNLIGIDVLREQKNIDYLQAQNDRLHFELMKLEEQRQEKIKRLQQLPGGLTGEQLSNLNKGFDNQRDELNLEIKLNTKDVEKGEKVIESLGDKASGVIRKTQQEIDDLGKTIIDLNNPVANFFGNLFDAFAKGGKGIKGVFKTLQKDIQQSLSDAFRNSIKEKLKFDVEFKGNIFDLGGYFKDTFSDAVSFVGKLFGGAGGTGGGGFFSGLANLFGGSSAAGGGSSSSGGGGFLSNLFGGGYAATNNMVGTGWQLAGAGTYAGIPAVGNSMPGGLFGGGTSNLGSAFGFGSGGGYAGSGVLNSAGGLISSAQNISNIAKIASLFSSGGSGSGLLSIIGNIGSILSVGKLLSGGLSGGLGGLFGGGVLAAGTGWQLAGAGVYPGIPGGLSNIVTNGGFGFGNLTNMGSGLLGGLIGGLIGNYIGNYINKTFGIGQTKKGQLGSMIGGTALGIGGGIAGGAYLGGTLGSVFPGLGNIIGAAIGALVGAVIGIVGGGAAGDALMPGRIKMEKKGISKIYNKVFDEEFGVVKEREAAGGFEQFKGPNSAATIALGNLFAKATKSGSGEKNGTQGSIVRFAGQGLANFKRWGLDAEEAKAHILQLAEAMGFDLEKGMNAVRANIEHGILSIKEFKEEIKESRKNLKQYGDTSNLTAKELSDLATANGNTGSRLVTLNEILAGTIDIVTEFNAFIDGTTVANNYLATSFEKANKEADTLKDQVGTLSTQIRDGKLSIEEATIEINKFRQEVGLAALDLDDFDISAEGIQAQIDLITKAIDTVREAIKGGLSAGITSVEFKKSDIEKGIKKSVYGAMVDAVVEGMVDGIVKASLVAGPISAAFAQIADLTSKFVAGDLSEIDFFAGLEDTFTNIQPAIDKLATAVGVTSERFRQMLADAGILPILLDQAAGSVGEIGQLLHDAGKGAILSGLAGGLDAEKIQKNFRRAIYGSLVDSIVDGFIDGFIKATLATGPLEAAMKNIRGLIDKFVAGDINFDQFGQLLGDEFKNITPLIERIAVALGLSTEALRKILETAGILPDILDEANDNAKNLAKELRKVAKDLLLDSTLSPLKPKQRVAEAQAEFEDLRRRALAGDEEAARLLPEAARRFLEDARKVFASSAQYEAIFDFVRATLLDVADKFGPLEDTETKQLRTLEEVRAYLRSIDINLARLSGNNANQENNANQANNASLLSNNETERNGANNINSANWQGRILANNENMQGDRSYRATNNSALFQDSRKLVNQLTDELALTGSDKERDNTEQKLIAAAQLLTLQTINESLISADKTLRKISGYVEEQLNREIDTVRRKPENSASMELLRRSSSGDSDNRIGDRLYNSTNNNQQQADNRDVIGVLLGIESAIIRPSGNSATATTNSLLAEIREYTQNTGTNTWITQGHALNIANNTSNINEGVGWSRVHLREIRDILASKSSSLSLAEGGIVMGSSMPATLHGPEAVIPLPYGTGGGIHFSSPELVEEVRGLREEMRNMPRESTEQRPVIVQGDFNVGQVKLGEFVQKTVQVALNAQQIRVPRKSIER